MLTISAWPHSVPLPEAITPLRMVTLAESKTRRCQAGPATSRPQQRNDRGMAIAMRSCTDRRGIAGQATAPDTGPERSSIAVSTGTTRQWHSASFKAARDCAEGPWHSGPRRCLDRHHRAGGSLEPTGGHSRRGSYGLQIRTSLAISSAISKFEATFDHGRPRS